MNELIYNALSEEEEERSDIHHSNIKHELLNRLLSERLVLEVILPDLYDKLGNMLLLDEDASSCGKYTADITNA